ncbi:MAG: hypothetical protein JWR80_3180 [Bradyrhizobium sp.]|nr:hypothetical protein [Bradyrhizobium sp.]
MRPFQVTRQARRALSVLSTNGPRQFSRKLIGKLREKLGLSRRHQQYFTRKALFDSAFDAQWGIDTGGIQRLHDLNIDSPSARFGTSHIASDPQEFSAALASIDLPLDSFTFIDLGSGKGRALILASAFPFERIIGIEFAQELNDVAQRNVAYLKERDPRASRIQPLCCDAATYRFPDGPLVLFLFHPFDSPIMKAVAANAMATWRANPRPVRVVYVNPLYLADWTDAGWAIIAREHYHVVLAPEPGATPLPA